LTPPIRQKAFDIIDGEREYQDANFPSSPDTSLVDFASLLIEYTGKLAVDVVVESSSPTGGPLKRLREIAAIAVRAMEIHGAQPRENHVPASAGVTGVAHIVAKADMTKPVAQSLHPPLAAAHHTPEPVTEHTTQHGIPEHHK
jgi:hypothetical protein